MAKFQSDYKIYKLHNHCHVPSDEQTKAVSSPFDLFSNHTRNRGIQKIIIQNEFFIKKTSSNSLVKEFEIMKKFDHHLIGKVINQEEPYSFIMEFYSGGNIKCDSPLQTSEAKRLFTQMAQSVQVLHNRSYVHLDIRLNNFVLTSSDSLKLIDFGHATNENPLAIKEELGSSKYNSPERSKGEYSGFKADIYSLGIILFRLLVGEYPFNNSSSQSSRFNLYTSDPDRYWTRLLVHVNKLYNSFEINEDARDLIDWMLEYDPEDRPSIEDVLHHKFCE